jgi:hypothetical protein
MRGAGLERRVAGLERRVAGLERRVAWFLGLLDALRI